MKKNCFTFLLLGFCFYNQAFAQTKKDSLASFITNTTDSIYKKENIPGIFVSILNNNERHFFSAGFADTEKQTRYDSATMFEIGSITKTFTAYILTAVLMENNIADTDRIIKYLPAFVQKNQNLSSISFLSLMNHTSGLPRLPDNMKPVDSRQPYEGYTSVELFAYLKDCRPLPDGKSNYSNLGAGIAGVLAEKISGKSYAALLDQYIFLPFKMVSPENAIDANKNKSTGYFAKDDKTAYWNMDVLAPAGGLKCTGKEMLIYLDNMCFPKSATSKKIIDKLTTATVSINPRVSVGLGWHILNEKDKQPIYWHNGGTYGFSTFCAFLKDKSKAVMIVINQFNKNALSDGLGIKIMKRLISEE